jgi:succinyl-diaminopimelate desuccinylase
MPRLTALGFSTHEVPSNSCSNLLALRGAGERVFAFSGHTDVVPPGEGWSVDPFAGIVVGDRLIGRGVADMKGSVAAFIVALEEFTAHHPTASLPLALLIAGDEETTGEGTPALLEHLEKIGIKVGWCLVGEPSSTSELGDCIRVGRRGSVGATVTITGVQGHAAYPQLAKNPIHAAVALLNDLISTDFDAELPCEPLSGDGDGWPRTSLQATRMSSGLDSAANVIPGSAQLRFNVRFRPPHTRETLITRLTARLESIGLPYEAKWSDGMVAYDSSPGILRESVVSAIRQRYGLEARLSRDGGSSDGRFVAAIGAEVVECGPSNETIHKVDEGLLVSQLVQLVELYYDVLVTMNERVGRCVRA